MLSAYMMTRPLMWRAARPAAGPAELLIAIESDYLYRLRCIQYAERKAALGGAPVYMYLLAWQAPALEGIFGAPHTAIITTDLPLGIYNNPPRVKSDLNWDHLLRIFKHPNYVIHKESTARVGQVAQVLAGKPTVSVMCCDSPNLGLVVPTMSLGGHGTANMTGNLAPAELATISKPWTSYAEAEGFKNAYLGLLPLLHYTYSAINPVAVKSLMKAVGLPAGNLRKPLIIFTPKSLLRSKAAVSSLSEFTTGHFHPLITDPGFEGPQIRKVLMCSGKVYYDLEAYRAKNGITDVAILRFERLYPLPWRTLPPALEKYPNAHVTALDWGSVLAVAAESARATASDSAETLATALEELITARVDKMSKKVSGAA